MSPTNSIEALHRIESAQQPHFAFRFDTARHIFQIICRPEFILDWILRPTQPQLVIRIGEPPTDPRARRGALEPSTRSGR